MRAGNQYQKIFINQSKYLNKFLVCFNITTNPISTPLPFVKIVNDKINFLLFYFPFILFSYFLL